MLNRSSDAEIDFDFDKVKKKSRIIHYIMYNIAMLEFARYSDI